MSGMPTESAPWEKKLETRATDAPAAKKKVREWCVNVGVMVLFVAMIWFVSLTEPGVALSVWVSGG